VTGGWGRRIWLIGPAGAGKSTLARRLHARLAVPHEELDRLFWLPDWRQATVPGFRAAVAELADRDAWILDGQYQLVHDILRERADLVIWLDPPPGVTFRRLVARTGRRLLSREELWNANHERLSGAIGLLRWALGQYPKVRRCNHELATFLAERHVPCLRIRSATESARLLAAMPSEMEIA
jgi:adenylate kinase family enzyme